MTFNNVIGQHALKGVLNDALSSHRIAHCYLFEGPNGIGKRTIADIFAKMVMCTNIQEDSDSGNLLPCDICDSCIMFNNMTHPDYHYFATDNETIKINEVRDYFDGINLTPYYATKKIYIIDGVEKMTIQSQNCILKTLEEPPLDVIIMLLTENKEVLLETINSRVLSYSLKRYSKGEINQALDRDIADTKEVGVIDRSALSYDFIHAFSDGIIGKAIDLYEDNEFKELRDRTFDIIKSIETLSMKKMIEAIDDILGLNKVKVMIEFFISYYRDVLVLQLTDDVSVLINSDKKDIIQDSKGRISIDGVINMFQIINEALIALNTNANNSLVVEGFIMRLREEYL